MHIISGLSGGGAERALFNILAGGAGARYTSVVISLRDDGVYGARIRALGIRVYSVGMGLRSALAMIKVAALARSFKPDVIQGWMYHGNLVASLVAMSVPRGSTLLWNVRHSLYDLSLEKPVTRQVIRANRLFSRFPQTIVYNSRVAKTQHERFGFASKAGQIIANGFDIQALAPSCERRSAVRQTLGFSRGELVVGHVARHHPMKDHRGFIRAALAVLERFWNVRFLLVGRDVTLDNPVFKDLIPDHLKYRFTLLGDRADVYNLMHAIDVVCVSSAWGEGFPNVLGEAMSCGVPCVATEVGDSTDIVGDTGIVVPPSDSVSLARGLLAMVEMPEESRRALGRSARERVIRNYCITTVVGEYIRLYEGVLAKEK